MPNLLWITHRSDLIVQRNVFLILLWYKMLLFPLKLLEKTKWNKALTVNELETAVFKCSHSLMITLFWFLTLYGQVNVFEVCLNQSLFPSAWLSFPLLTSFGQSHTEAVFCEVNDRKMWRQLDMLVKTSEIREESVLVKRANTDRVII